MAHFAKIDENNVVVEVLVVPDEKEAYGEEYLLSLGLEGRFIQTSFNNNFRSKFAAIGDEYLEAEDTFRGPSPYPSWIYDEDKGFWEAPQPTPEHDSSISYIVWNEEKLSWDILEK